jgi:Skp family chaperone for outer membrane proteins
MTIAKALPASAALLLAAFSLNSVWAQPAAAPAAPRPAAAPAAAAPAAARPAAAAAGPAKAAVILFVDRGAIVRNSAVGKDMFKQVEALAKKMEADYKPENDKLQADFQTLQSQFQVLAPDAREAKRRELEARRQAFQKKVQDRQAEIQGGMNKARQQLEAALGPILEQMMVERSANLLLDRSMVVLGSVDLDVTQVAVQRLDRALPKITVTPQKPAAAPAAAGAPAAAPRPAAPAAPRPAAPPAQ